jgi:low affinity Fe/Cu permease
VGQQTDQVTLPSEVCGDAGLFDRFAGSAARIASRAPFFAFCVLLIVVWAPSVAILRFDTWQLIINTATTIVTFLMVALLQNSQTRNDGATQHKLNAVADGLADLMRHLAEQHKDDSLHEDIKELRLAVGLETRETTSGNGSSPTDASTAASR